MNLLTKLFSSSPKVDEQAIIAEIHNEFDTAQDKLLQQAKQILSELDKFQINKSEIEAMRLQNIGFVNTPLVKKMSEFSVKRQDKESQIVKTKKEAELIQHYQFTYPLMKFLTIEELERICNKYNLIYAPVGNFIKDVPEKNITEIEKSKELLSSDKSGTKFFLKVNKFWDDAPKEIKELLKNEVLHSKTDSESPSESEVAELVKTLGYTGSYTGYIYIEQQP